MTLIITNRINRKILSSATTKLTGMGFSYSVLTFGVLAAGAAVFFPVFFVVDFEEVPVVEVFFFASETIFSALLAVFFSAMKYLLRP